MPKSSALSLWHISSSQAQSDQLRPDPVICNTSEVPRLPERLQGSRMTTNSVDLLSFLSLMRCILDPRTPQAPTQYGRITLIHRYNSSTAALDVSRSLSLFKITSVFSRLACLWVGDKAPSSRAPADMGDMLSTARSEVRAPNQATIAHSGLPPLSADVVSQHPRSAVCYQTVLAERHLRR